MVHPGSELYGSDRVMLDTAVAAVEHGWTVVAVTPTTGPLTDRLVSIGVQTLTIDFPVLRKAAMSPGGILRLVLTALSTSISILRIFFRVKPDVLYVSTITVPTWILMGRLLRRPIVCHLHEAEPDASRVVRWLLAAPVSMTDLVISNSEFSLSVLKGSLGRPRFDAEVIYNAVTLDEEIVEPRQSLEGAAKVLFIGRLSPRKGPDVAIRAVAHLRDMGTDVELSLLGASFEGYEWYEESLRSLCRELGVEDRVTFLGFHDVVEPHLARADIVLIPSTKPEPFGNTAVEAVISARPVVVSSTGGLVEAVDGFDSALSVRPGSSSEVAEACRTIIDEWPRFRQIAMESSSVARTRHSLAVYARRIGGILDRIGGS